MDPILGAACVGGAANWLLTGETLAGQSAVLRDSLLKYRIQSTTAAASASMVVRKSPGGIERERRRVSSAKHYADAYTQQLARIWFVDHPSVLAPITLRKALRNARLLISEQISCDSAIAKSPVDCPRPR